MAEPPVRNVAGGNMPTFVVDALTLSDGWIWTATTVQLGGVISYGPGGIGGTAADGAIDVAASPLGAPTALDAGSIVLGADGDNPDTTAPRSGQARTAVA